MIDETAEKRMEKVRKQTGHSIHQKNKTKKTHTHKKKKQTNIKKLVGQKDSEQEQYEITKLCQS